MAITYTNYNDDKRFSKENVTLSKDFPIKFCCFNAYQMRDLIIRKLTEDPQVRNQIYPGSNISILIDLVATMYQTLAYQLNHAASESMFSQSQYYENIVRLAKLIGYNAQGITPSTAMIRIDNVSELYEDNPNVDLEIPPFAFISTNEGKYYSYSPNLWEGCHLPRNLENGTPFDMILHNGIWKKYKNVLTPNGQDFETFVLSGLNSDIDNQGYATTSHLFAVEVIKAMREDNEELVDWNKTTVNIFHPTNCGLFKGISNTNDINQIHNFLYNGIGQDKYVFNVELSESKQIVIRFGDGITTQKLVPNSELHLFYLETQGMNGGIQSSDETLSFQTPQSMLGIEPELWRKLFGSNVSSDQDFVKNIKCHVLTSSTSAIREEGPDQIRERAPNWFKMNNRLVTLDDYEFFLMNEPSISGIFNSVKAMNNWEYASTFYAWLNQLGVSKHNNPRFYLNPARFTKYGGASLSDAVDSNNVYIWYITNFGDVDDINYEQMVQRCKSMMMDIKDICQEPVLIPALPIRCEISSIPLELAQKYLQSNRSTTVPKHKDEKGNSEDASWLEVRINDNYSISSYEVVERVCSLFTWFFNVNNRKVGFGSFDTNDIVNLIMEKIPAISDIYTVYRPNSNSNPIYTHGISMACFCPNTSLINLGDDLQIGSGHISLENFMFPVLYTNTENELKNRIKVVNKNINILSRNNY